jgi:hypothetical protein
VLNGLIRDSRLPEWEREILRVEDGPCQPLSGFALLQCMSQVLCRFSDAGNDDLTTRSGSRLLSSKAMVVNVAERINGNTSLRWLAKDAPEIEVEAFLKADAELWGRVIKEAGIAPQDRSYFLGRKRQ